jgi:hypothetical protein
MRRLFTAVGLLIATCALAGPALADGIDTPASLPVFLYADTVNGSRPVGVAQRPTGSCTQTNIYRRGEQLVFRIWGSESESGDVLSPENVKYAYVKIAGLPNQKLNWGAHGATTNRVWFWTAAWNIAADYPLGTVKARIVFKTESNTFGTLDHVLTINP